jgi:hypothetical protein
LGNQGFNPTLLIVDTIVWKTKGSIQHSSSSPTELIVDTIVWDSRGSIQHSSSSPTGLIVDTVEDRIRELCGRKSAT